MSRPQVTSSGIPFSNYLTKTAAIWPHLFTPLCNPSVTDISALIGAGGGLLTRSSSEAHPYLC